MAPAKVRTSGMTQRFYEPVYPLAFDDEWSEPVPGWGFNPLWAGPRMIAVGADESVKTSPVLTQAQSEASALYHDIQISAQTHPLYYLGGAVAAGLLASSLAPSGKGVMAGAVGALLGIVGVHLLSRGSKPSLIASGTNLPTGPGVYVPPGSVDESSTVTPSVSTAAAADQPKPVISLFATPPTQDASSDVVKPVAPAAASPGTLDLRDQIIAPVRPGAV